MCAHYSESFAYRDVCHQFLLFITLEISLSTNVAVVSTRLGGWATMLSVLVQKFV